MGLVGCEKGLVLAVDHHLGQHRGHLLVDGALAQLVEDGPLQHVAHAALGHGVADVEGKSGDGGGRRLHLQQDVAHLRAVAVDDDQLVALADDLHHQLRRFLGVAVLFLGRALFAGLQHGIAPKSDQSQFLSHLLLSPKTSGSGRSPQGAAVRSDPPAAGPIF